MAKKKKKTEEGTQDKPARQVKVVYYDDGSTVADMSGTRKGKELPPRQKSTFREKARTFFAVMRRMVLPMICTLVAFSIVFLIFFLANKVING